MGACQEWQHSTIGRPKLPPIPSLGPACWGITALLVLPQAPVSAAKRTGADGQDWVCER